MSDTKRAKHITIKRSSTGPQVLVLVMLIKLNKINKLISPIFSLGGVRSLVEVQSPRPLFPLSISHSYRYSSFLKISQNQKWLRNG